MTDLQTENYIAAHSTPPCELLHELWRYTWLHTIYPRMAAGPQHGLLLQMICRMIRPQRVLEIGTFTGYSTIAMALATPDESRIISIEANEEYLDIAAKFVEKSRLKHKISLIHGNAQVILNQLNDQFDLIYLDADKMSYPVYFSNLKRLLKKGGFLLADNVLWGGKVPDSTVNDKETESIRSFNRLVSNDLDFEQLLLPLHDGLLLAQRIG
jgi:predicted O-methyltransferase YrrM